MLRREMLKGGMLGAVLSWLGAKPAGTETQAELTTYGGTILGQPSRSGDKIFFSVPKVGVKGLRDGNTKLDALFGKTRV